MTAMGLRSAGGVGCGVCFGAVMKVHTAAGGVFSQEGSTLKPKPTPTRNVRWGLTGVFGQFRCILCPPWAGTG